MILDTGNLPILPVGWTVTDLEQISEINPKISGDDFSEEIEVSFVPMRCVEELTGRVELSLKRKISEVKKGYTSFADGDLLFAKITPCMENGKIAIVNDLTNGIGFGSTEFHVIRLHEVLPKLFFFYYLIQEDLRKDAQRNMTGSAGQLRVPVNYIRKLTLPFPPPSEQHRIVDKIEELFTKLDAGVEALKKIKEQLKRYRQAVLKYAFEGKLTAEWREQHKDELEPASVLLERIREERKKALGKKYKELPPVDTSDLPELPEGWVWTRVEGIYDIIGGGTPSTKVAEYWEGDIPWISSADIYGLKDIRPRKQITKKAIDNSATNLVPDGSLIVVTRVGLGKIALANVPMCFSQDSQALIDNGSFLNPDYSLYYLSQTVQIFKYKHRGTTIAGVTKKQLAELEFVLPSLKEQQKIVEEIEQRLSIADQIEKTVDQSLKQSDRLRQSILKKAFEGKLVPQDPTDEPAELLLERIKAEKAAKEMERSSKTKVKRVKATRQMASSD